MQEFSRGFERAHVQQIERADAQRRHRKEDADALADAKNFFLDRQGKRIEIDAAR